MGCGKHQLFVAVRDVLDDARLVEVEQLRVVRAVSGRVARVHLRRAELHLRPATHRPHHAAGSQVGGRRRLVISSDHHGLDVRLVRSPDWIGDPDHQLRSGLCQRRHLGPGCRARCAVPAASALWRPRSKQLSAGVVKVSANVALHRSAQLEFVEKLLDDATTGNNEPNGIILSLDGDLISHHTRAPATTHVLRAHRARL